MWLLHSAIKQAENSEFPPLFIDISSEVLLWKYICFFYSMFAQPIHFSTQNLLYPTTKLTVTFRGSYT